MPSPYPVATPLPRRASVAVDVGGVVIGGA